MYFEEATEKWVAERSEFVPVRGLIVIRKLSEIDSAQPLSSTFAIFGVRGFITAFLSVNVEGFFERLDQHRSVPKMPHREKAKRQSIAALQMKWQKSG